MLCHFTSHGMLHEFGAEKPISWAKPAHFDFFAVNFTLSSHMLSSVEDALRVNERTQNTKENKLDGAFRGR
jgi:hypothetical protein